MHQQTAIFASPTIFTMSGIQEKIALMYKTYFIPVKAYVMANNGNEDDARDTFQDIIFAYVKQFQNNTLPEISNEKAYILGMARNIWLKHIRDNKKLSSFEESIEAQNIPMVDNLPEVIQKNSMIDVVLSKLEELTEECKKIIHASFYAKRSASEIAVETGYSEQFIKVKKHRCLQGLKKLVTGSEDFINYLN